MYNKRKRETRRANTKINRFVFLPNKLMLMSNKFMYLAAIAICLFVLQACGNTVVQPEINELIEENKKLELVKYDLKKQLSQIVDICTAYECPNLHTDTPYGIKTITGYYQKVDKIDWGEVEVICDTFVITDGSEVFIDKYKKLVEIGNSVNFLNNHGQIVFNIDISDLSKSDILKIHDSSKENLIELVILNPFVEGGRGVPVCYSFIDILKVK